MLVHCSYYYLEIVHNLVQKGLLLTAAAAVFAAVGASIPASAVTTKVKQITLSGTRSGIVAGSNVSDWTNTVKCTNASQSYDPDNIHVNILLQRNTLQADCTTWQYEEFTEDVFWPGDYKAKIVLETTEESGYLLSYLDTIYFDNTHWMNGNSTHPINKEHSRYVWFETEITVDWLEFNSDTSTLFLRSTKNSYGQFLTVSKASILT